MTSLFDVRSISCIPPHSRAHVPHRGHELVSQVGHVAAMSCKMSTAWESKDIKLSHAFEEAGSCPTRLGNSTAEMDGTCHGKGANLNFNHISVKKPK